MSIQRHGEQLFVDAPGMILGLDLLGDRRFVVDYPGKRLLIQRQP